MNTISTLAGAPTSPVGSPATPPPAQDPPAPQDVVVAYNAQDPTQMPPAPTTVRGVEPGLRVAKAELLDSNLEPVDGKYVYPEGDTRNVAAASFAATAKTIEAFEAALGEPVRWAFGSERLGIYADDGEMLNAYYSRGAESIHFFHGEDPVLGYSAYSGASGDVVSHEVGHAILDGLRPGYLGTWTPDPGGFHESFGDMLGILIALQDERTVQRVAIQTGGDLSKHSVLDAVGEELGRAINDSRGANRTGGDWVRTAINRFVWQDPATLPDRGGPDQLGSEVHSFSRLWTGAFWDVLKTIQAENMASGMDAQTALRATGQEGIKLLATLMKTAPQGDFTYREMAEAFVSSDQQFNGGKRADLIRQVYTDRLILQAPEPPTPPTPPPSDSPAPPSGLLTMTSDGTKSLDDVTRSVRVKLNGSQFGMFDGAVVDTVVDKDGSLSKDTQVAQRTRDNLQRHIAAGRIRYNDPAYRMKAEDYFDKNGNPYVGVTRWENGQMVIERVKIAT